MHTPVSIEKIFTTCYKKGITFSKNTAMKLVGSRTRLERLVAEGKIRMESKGEAQNSKWQLNAGDVLYHAK